MEQILTSFAPSSSPTQPSVTSPAALDRTVKVPTWSDDQKPLNYFLKFEKAMLCNSTPQARRGHLLPIYISGKLESAFHSEVPAEMIGDYAAVMSKFLKSLGDTPLRTGYRKFKRRGLLNTPTLTIHAVLQTIIFENEAKYI